MPWGVILAEALAALRANARRLAPMCVGVAWGVACTLVLGAIAAGFEAAQRRELEGVGDSFRLCRAIHAPKGRTDGRFAAIVQLQLEDLQAVARECPAVEAVAPKAFHFGSNFVLNGRKYTDSTLVGVDLEYPRVCNVPLEPGGRWLDADDLAVGRPVAVLGPRAKRELFGEQDAVGRELTFVREGRGNETRGHRLTVVGVLADVEWNTDLWYASHQDLVFVPAPLIERWCQRGFTFFVLRPTKPELADVALEQAHRVLSRRLGFSETTPGAIAVYYDSAQRAVALRGLFEGLRGFLGLVGTCIMLLGAIGIANVTIVSVLARRAEFGIRRAVGARPAWIFLQVFTETLLAAGASALLGAALAAAALAGLGAVELPDGFPAPRVDTATMGYALGAFTLVSLAAAAWPASRAARPSVIETLRGADL